MMRPHVSLIVDRFIFGVHLHVESPEFKSENQFDSSGTTGGRLRDKPQVEENQFSVGLTGEQSV